MYKKWSQLAVAAMMTAGLSWAVTPAHPGTVNYIEGQATVDGKSVSVRSAGDIDVAPGEVLSVSQGRAEMLLTPGVFLRLGDGSAAKMISPGLTDTRVELLHGQAMVEATNLQKENHISIVDRQATVTLVKNGLYAIDGGRIAVIEGKAQVQEDDHHVDVKGGHEVVLSGPLKSQKFDKKGEVANDPLYEWSRVRSEYLAEASASMAQSYYADPGAWYGAGWYWDPGWGTWSFLPGAGFAYSPFGWGFYSPAYFGYYGGYGFVPGYYARPGHVWRSPGARTSPAFRGHSIGGFRGHSAGGFRGASGASRGGMGGGFRGRGR